MAFSCPEVVMLIRIPATRLLAILAVGLLFGGCRETAAPVESAVRGPQFSTAPGDGLHGAIAFHSNRGSGVFEIFVMNADGTGVTQLTHTTVHNFDPIWSPNGNQIAFGRVSGCFCAFSVVVINADGSGEKVLTDNGFPGAWSPDGKRIAFSGPGGVFVMNRDGTGVTQLTSFNGEGPADWSQDGKQILLVSRRSGTNQLYVMNADGTGVTRLTNGPANNEGDHASWSPDGKRIVFASDRDGGRLQIFVMNADGTGVTQLTSGFTNDDPVWSPDGMRIAFQSTRDGHEEVYVMNAD